MDIARPRPPNSRSTSLATSTSALVGSPETIDTFSNEERAEFHDHGPAASLLPFPSRPSLSTRISNATISSVLNPASVASSGRASDQWTLFGQLMGSEFAERPTSATEGPTSPLQSPQRRRIVQIHELSTDDSLSVRSRTSLSLGPENQSRWPSLLHFLVLTPVQRNIIKCSIAYFVASLFTFSPYLSSLISDLVSYGPELMGSSPSAHMVATIAVYFNPAKTMGAMIEADLFCFFGLIYAAIVCLGSMSMFWWLELQPGWEWLGDVIAVTWIGISMSLLAWLKVWMANPSFNTACSMTAILIFVVLVKEGGWETLFQVSVIIICGAVVSNLVCFFVWPQQAIYNLLANMTNTLESFSTLLPTLTGIFLLETDDGVAAIDRVRKAVENHQNSFTVLQKNLNESKSEWIFRWTSIHDTVAASSNQEHRDLTGRRAYEDAVDSLNRLGQHLNGLRSGTQLQRDLLKANALTENNRADIDTQADNYAKPLDSISLFKELIDELGPPLRALSTTSSTTLNRLREVCEESRTKHRGADGLQSDEFVDLVDGIEAALVRFESTSNHAVLRLYRRSDILSEPSLPTSSMKPPPAEDEKDNVFLVYFFIFTLQELAKELVFLVDAIERIYCYEQRALRRGPWWSQVFYLVRRVGTAVTAFWGKRGKVNNQGGLRRSLSAYMMPRHRIVPPFFPKVRPHAPDTVQTPPLSTLSLVGKINHVIWTIGKRLVERDTKYAIKAGMATALLSLPAFVDVTRPFFLAYWGDWALISFFIVISPTIGATNYIGLQRFLGTLCGALVAMALYTVFTENAVALSVCGFVFSLPCFYFAVATPQYLSASRFVLLTYNLTCLYCYNLGTDISVVEIGFHRFLAVTAGILWAAFVSRFWWPSEARRELSKSLSEFCLNIGWLYTRLVAFNSYAPEPQQGTSAHTVFDADRIASHDTRMQFLPNSIREFMAMELHLQIKLIELQNLLLQAQHEPRLKGPFPVDLYRSILASLQIILDRLHSMRCVTTREEWHTTVRRDFIIPVNKERREMVGNIVLSFFTLASAFSLKAPLPPYLPPAEKARLRLVEAIRRLDIVKNRDVKASRQLLFFAYALTMKGVTCELESLGKTLQNAFGIIGQTPEDFEALFLPTDSAQSTIEHVA